MMTLKKGLIFPLLFLSLMAFTYVQSGAKWEKLGSKKVNVRGDHDEIIVTAHEGAFTKIKLRVLKSDIHLTNVRIIFGNGADKNVAFNKVIQAGQHTRVIDLPGNKRIIKKINLNYKSLKDGNGRAVVSVWGRH